MSSSNSSSIGFPGLLTLLFITLKLFNVTTVATWSWWWVLSPLWISLALFLVIVLGLLAFAGGLVGLAKLFSR